MVAFVYMKFSSIALRLLFLVCVLALAFTTASHASTPRFDTNPILDAPFNECSFQWDIKARGVYLGTTHDVIRWNAAFTNVNSTFTPNVMATLLGAPALDRKWLSLKQGGIAREENKYRNKSEINNVQWFAKNGQLWKKMNRDDPQEFSVPNSTSSLRYIDSTIFAYLDLVGQPLSKTPAQVWVLSRQAPYLATTRQTANTVEFNAGTKRGTVWLQAGKPTKLSFFDGGYTFEAYAVSSNCK